MKNIFVLFILLALSCQKSHSMCNPDEIIDYAYDGNLDMVKCAISKDADIEKTDDYGYTSLIWAAENGNFDVVKYLIEQKADVNAINNHGYTALIMAAEDGFIDIVKYLIEQKADMNIHADDGYTVLISAVYGGYADIVKHLIKSRVSLDSKRADGKTALQLAREILSKLHEEVNPDKDDIDVEKEKEIYREIVTALEEASK